MSCSSSGETNCINTASGNCHPVLVAVLCAGWEFTPNQHTTLPLLKTDSRHCIENSVVQSRAEVQYTGVQTQHLAYCDHVKGGNLLEKYK